MVSDFLKEGADNAVSADRLQRMTGYRSKREMTKAIERERIGGTLILSNGSGYYLPGNKQEIDRFIKSMTKRAKSIFRVLKAARMAAGESEEQITLAQYFEATSGGKDNGKE